MSRYIFLFDLDSTLTRQEILPTVSEHLDVYEKMYQLTESTMSGELPFRQSFLRRVKLLENIPVSKVRACVSGIELNEGLVGFIRRNRERCYIVTGNLDIWIEDLIKKIGIEGNVYCSKALVENDHIRDIFSIVDKSAVVSQLIMPYVAVGDGNNDAEMIEGAEIGIGYGGVRSIAPAVLECASHAIYDEDKLVEFLERLL